MALQSFAEPEFKYILRNIFFTAMRYQKESSLICQVYTDTGHPLVDLCRPDVFTTLLKNFAFSLVLRFMSVAIGIHMLYFFYFGRMQRSSSVQYVLIHDSS